MSDTIKLSEFLEIFEFNLKNNKRLEDAGNRPIAINIEGPAGIGKTESILGYCKEHDITVAQLNLAELEDIGDMSGFPIKEVEICALDKDNMKTVIGTKWVPENQSINLPVHVRTTGRTRTSYAPPVWVPREFNPNGTVLFLDDYTRKQIKSK